MNDKLPETRKNEYEIDVLQMFGIIFKYKLLIILMTSCVIVAVLSFSILLKP